MLQPRDLITAADLACHSLEPFVASPNWDQPARDLEWTCRHTLLHAGGAPYFYAIQLATRATERLDVGPRFLAPPTEYSVRQALNLVRARAALLRDVTTAAPAGARAWHPNGLADPEGFVAMGCDELLVHTFDIAEGLGGSFAPPEDLAARVLARLFPWVQVRDGSAWQAVLWANGRVAVADAPRVEGAWAWHCAPLAEWDGSVPTRTR